MSLSLTFLLTRKLWTILCKYHEQSCFYQWHHSTLVPQPSPALSGYEPRYFKTSQIRNRWTAKVALSMCHGGWKPPSSCVDESVPSRACKIWYEKSRRVCSIKVSNWNRTFPISLIDDFQLPLHSKSLTSQVRQIDPADTLIARLCIVKSFLSADKSRGAPHTNE